MGEYHLLQPRKRKFNHPQTTNSRHKLLVYTNEIKLLGSVVPGRVWVSDVTYVWCENKWIYVAIVMDQSSRKVVGWSVSKSLSRRLCIEALNMALSSNKAPEFHHSDRGVQYCSHDYINILKENNITPSMADVGMSVDNPHAEAFNRSFKVEEVYLNCYESFEEAKNSIARYILCYNTKRLHSSLGYMPPREFEAHYYLKLSKRDNIGVSI
jgi:transposase InsO family protein